MVIVMVIGVVAIAVGPDLSALYDTLKVKQTVTELRTSLQDTQRQAIRKNQSCLFEISSNQIDQTAQVNGNCLRSGAPLFPKGVTVATNLDPQAKLPLDPPPTSPLGARTYTPTTQPPPSAKIGFSSLGNASFVIISTQRPPALPRDPSAKMVAYIPRSQSLKKQCVAVSNTLGLTRLGTYSGDLSPAAITDTGVCTALDWKDQ
jgi:type II secretory pathway pseudopilin PulG